MNNKSAAITLSELTKRYKSLQALKQVNLEIPQGEFFGLLGPNGAGKSTLIHCIVGLCNPSEGQAFILGKSVQKDYRFTKKQIGFSPQEPNVDRFFNLYKTLQFQGGFFGLDFKQRKKRALELLEQFGLKEKSKEQFFKLSGGMQKRLLIARALMNDPKVLILDEPTAGVDVAQRYELWKFLKALNEQGTTILLTTHYIDEAQYLCSRVGIINHGQIIETGSPADLIEKYCENRIFFSLSEPADPQEFSTSDHIQVEGTRIQATGPYLGIVAEQVLKQVLQKPGRRVLDINVNKGDLEEVFVKLTGKTIHQEDM